MRPPNSIMEELEPDIGPTLEEDDVEGEYIVALIQNRAKEVGMAALEVHGRSQLYLAQYVESTRSYSNTLTMLQIYRPKKLLLVASRDLIADISFNEALKEYKPCIGLVSRTYFDDTDGTVLLQALASPASKAKLDVEKNNYLAMGAAGALVKYFQYDQNMVLEAASLEVTSVSQQHHMHLDGATIQALELVQPYKIGSSGRKGMTLYKLLDGTRTKAGAQLLRANLLQPLRDMTTLNLRYDTLSELQSEEFHPLVDDCLMQLPKNLDTLITALVLRPAKNEANTLRRIAAMIKSFILLRDLLRLLPSIVEVLQQSESELLQTLRTTCASPAFEEILSRIDELLEPDVGTSSNAFVSKTQCCFALKEGVDALLDVARASFSRLTEQVHELTDSLRDQHNLPHMKVQYTAKRGFCFSIGQPPKSRKRQGLGNTPEQNDDDLIPAARNNATTRPTRFNPGTLAAISAITGGGPQVPMGFSILSQNTKVVQCTTSELNALNSRIKEAGNTCLMLTEKILESVSADIVGPRFLPLLNRLVDGLALLDMMSGFSRALVSTGKEYCRPVLTDDNVGPLVIVQGRHPVLECIEDESSQNGQFQPNDAYMALNSSFNILTGPNMSGKSTYLRQVALITIMAQIGCLVPADMMMLPLVDAIYTRIGTGDCLESNSSSFMMEMQDTAYILDNATSKSLVLIDELGRATSTTDGIAIAWAVSEALAVIGCKTMFATHFVQLVDLQNVFPNVKAWNMEVNASSESLEFKWKLLPGMNESAGHYGLLLAKTVGFPDQVVVEAQAVADAVMQAEQQRLAVASTEQQAADEELWDLVAKLMCVAQSYKRSNNDEALQEQLKELVSSLEQADLGDGTNA